jgi:GT2 family glycosyltransferase
MKFSVIVPTMWMANDYFLQMLKFMVGNDAVGEIIIIDNNSKDRPTDDNLTNEKVKILDFGKNLFFNKSMNVGVENSKFELICLLNDDVIFDPAIFSSLAGAFKSEQFPRESVGMIYPHPAFFNRMEENIELIQKLEMVPCHETIDGYGCCMFVHKNNYKPIPEELVHHFGDVWFHKNQEMNGKTNFWLYNWVVMTVMRVTTEKVPEAHEKIIEDWKIAQEVFAKHGIQIEDHSRDFPVFKAGLLTRFSR